MQIILTAKDLPQETQAGSGMLIDTFAFSAGEYTQEEAYEYDESEYQTVDYVISNYDYEAALLTQTKEQDDLMALLKELDTRLILIRKIATKHAGAWLALNRPNDFATTLAAYTNKCKEEAHSYCESEFLTAYAPDLLKEIEDSIEEQQKHNYHEWLYGDYRNWAGILKVIAKYYGAEDVEYDEKTDTVTFEFELMTLHEAIYGSDYPLEEGGRPHVTDKEAKEWLLEQVVDSFDSQRAQKKAEQAKYKAEREHVAAYKAQQAARAEAERKAKLTKLIK